jgi:hypothetical protein
MSDEDIVDPRVVPRWVEAGVSGVPRGREWDAVATLELPELEAVSISELAFRVLEDGTVLTDEARLPPAALERLGAEAEAAVSLPCEALATRRGRRDWALAVRALRLERADLPPDLPAGELAVAVAPGGERTLLLDGEEPSLLTPELERAFGALEQRGQARYEAFVVRAERVGPDRWELTVDPL